MTPSPKPSSPPASSLVGHLLELRRRLLRSLLLILVITLALLPFANTLYNWLAAPLTQWLPAGSQIIATTVTAPFMVPLKLAFVTALFIAMPFLLWQIWAFIAPGLYRHEKRFALPLLAASVFLFYAGAAFAYGFICPMVFGFFVQAAPDSVAVMTDMSQHLDFTLTMFLAFGLAFQVPVVTLLLVRAGLVSVATLREKRPMVIIGCFVVGMFLTPPDVFSQTLLAVPMWLLYEVGLWLAARLPLTPDSHPSVPS